MEELKIRGASYIGRPVSGTAMFVTEKVSYLLKKLYTVKGCLVYAENGMIVPKELQTRHMFVFCDSPQREYAFYMTKYEQQRNILEQKKKYVLTEEGYYLGKDVVIGKNCYIEPFCLIGHGVVIGDNAQILSGAVIKNAEIGSDFICNEDALIGTRGFTITEDSEGNKYRIPTLGKVIIGNHVEIGTLDNISSGSGGNTIIEDYVKLDTMVHIGHDAHLCKNVEVTAGAVIGGFAEIGEGSFIGLSSIIRNRKSVGENARVSMGAVVTKDVLPGQTVTGNFAVDHQRFIKEMKESNLR